MKYIGFVIARVGKLPSACAHRFSPGHKFVTVFSNLTTPHPMVKKRGQSNSKFILILAKFSRGLRPTPLKFTFLNLMVFTQRFYICYTLLKTIKNHQKTKILNMLPLMKKKLKVIKRNDAFSYAASYQREHKLLKQ